MARTKANAELDSLIEEITVDCYDEDEQLHGFENAFDEDATLPCRGLVIGEEVQVLRVGQANDRHEPIATCQHNGHRYEIALLDVELDSDPDTSHRRWRRASSG